MDVHDDVDTRVSTALCRRAGHMPHATCTWTCDTTAESVPTQPLLLPFVWNRAFGWLRMCAAVRGCMMTAARASLAPSSLVFAPMRTAIAPLASITTCSATSRTSGCRVSHSRHVRLALLRRSARSNSRSVSVCAALRMVMVSDCDAASSGPSNSICVAW